MRTESQSFLRDLINTPSPSGFELPVRKLIAAEMKKYCDEVRQDVMGNVIGVINPRGKMRVMLAGHCDEIGIMITNITGEGYAYFATVGGWDPSILVGQRVIIHNERGTVSGVIGRKPIHLMAREQEDVNRVPKITEQWLDIGAKNKKDAEKVIAVGDYVTIDVGFKALRNDMVAGRGFDDRVGSFAVVETLRLLASERNKLKVAVYGVATTQEELGLRGAKVSAHGINPHAGIAIDVGFASDCPTINKNIVGDISLGKGPIISKGPNINSVLGSLLLKTAKGKKIPYQVDAAPGATPTDANAIQMTQAGVAAALVSVPNRYMHTPCEMVSLKDLDNVSKLLSATLLSMKGNEDFTPLG